MCPDGFLFHPTDPTSYLILSSHLLAETMEPSHVPVAFFFFFSYPLGAVVYLGM